MNAAKICSIDRTLISKYIKGVRRPKTNEAVLQMAQNLGMSQNEAIELLEAYKRDLIYEAYQVDYGIIKEIFETDCIIPKDISVPQSIQKINFQAESAKELYIKQEIIEILRYLLQGTAYIRISATFQSQEELLVLKEKLLQESNCNLEQIVAFEKKADGDRNKKLMYLKNLMFPMFYAEEGNVYYHYSGKEEISTALHNYIITDKGIIFFSADFRRGFFLTKK